MNTEQPSRMRMLAPIGLAVLAIIVLFVIATSLGGSDSGVDGGGGGGGSQGGQTKTEEKFYVVEPGDSLTAIADKTGVPVDRLTSLNPDLDPQALISGQRVKLR